MNPFTAPQTARAYAQGRPYFHPLVMEKVREAREAREALDLRFPVATAVDIACGTGLSSLALLALADRVVATDLSPEMLAHAPEDARIAYRLAPAEALPLANESAELITVSSAFHWFDRTVSSAFHWFDRTAFLREAQRVLCPQSWLVIYENFFRGQPENLAFTRWLESYYTAHPSPPRDRTPFTDSDAYEAGLEFFSRETYENTWSFGLTDFVAYLLSQSNAVVAVARGQSVDDLRAEFTEQLELFFGDGKTGCKVPFSFAGFVWILRRP